MKSIYKGVYSIRRKNGMSSQINCIDRNWRAMHMHKGVKWNGKDRETEREAALDYDKRMIELGLNPVNILVKK